MAFAGWNASHPLVWAAVTSILIRDMEPWKPLLTLMDEVFLCV